MTELHGLTEAGSEVQALDYRVLGQLEACVSGAPAALGGPKQRGVLAVLVAAAGRPVPVDALLHAIYGEDASPSSRATLHTYVSNLRHVLGDVIVRQGDAYLLDCADATIDAAAFEDVVPGAPWRWRTPTAPPPAARGVGDVARPSLRRRRSPRRPRR